MLVVVKINTTKVYKETTQIYLPSPYPQAYYPSLLAQVTNFKTGWYSFTLRFEQKEKKEKYIYICTCTYTYMNLPNTRAHTQNTRISAQIHCMNSTVSLPQFIYQSPNPSMITSGDRAWLLKRQLKLNGVIRVGP